MRTEYRHTQATIGTYKRVFIHKNQYKIFSSDFAKQNNLTVKRSGHYFFRFFITMITILVSNGTENNDTNTGREQVILFAI